MKNYKTSNLTVIVLFLVSFVATAQVSLDDFFTDIDEDKKVELLDYNFIIGIHGPFSYRMAPIPPGGNTISDVFHNDMKYPNTAGAFFLKQRSKKFGIGGEYSLIWDEGSYKDNVDNITQKIQTHYLGFLGGVQNFSNDEKLFYMFHFGAGYLLYRSDFQNSSLNKYDITYGGTMAMAFGLSGTYKINPSLGAGARIQLIFGAEGTRSSPFVEMASKESLSRIEMGFQFTYFQKNKK